MNKLYQGALACAVAAFVAGCGGNTSSSTTAAPSMAATIVTSQTSAQQATHSVEDYYPMVQSIYISYFGRPADPAGLRQFAEYLQAMNAPTSLVELNTLAYTNVQLQNLLNGFNSSQESQELYAGDNSAFIDAIYQNLFGRAPDADGKAFWLGKVNSGEMTRARASLNILSGAYNDPSSGDVAAINNRATVAANFTTALDTGVEVRGYRGQAAAQSVRTILRTVNSATDPASLSGQITATINTLKAAVPLSAEGMYHNDIDATGNTDLNLLVLDDDTVWAFYGVERNSQYDLFGYAKSSAIGNGTSLTGAMKDYGNGTGADTTLNVNYSAGSNLTGAIQTNNGPLSINAAPVASSVYNYNTGANINEITGTWTMSQRVREPQATVTVNANGTFTGTVSGCTFIGALKGRANRNVFDMTMQYSTGCDQAGTVVTGIGLSMLSNSGANREFILLGANTPWNRSSMFWGVRPK
ncbi:DUF4214 domain-containing protein [Massilia arenosa]|uniref:DUF4214 domain-containing protein n=1 Tax=Zemynaea arenosa TaxID=2561931 RepID=A0A4Y9S1L2_9BURK|nr:DUF4214 domain-containing protein [Massilia arenosa]TFW13809.1 DUF4214 domain-containing protein [Massilia arenosa]